MLGYNYPGDIWYADAYKLLTSKGLKPAVEPKSDGGRGIFRLPFTRDKEKTIEPPKAQDPNIAVQASKQADKKTIFRMPFGKKDQKPLPEPAPETPPSSH